MKAHAHGMVGGQLGGAGLRRKQRDCPGAWPVGLIEHTAYEPTTLAIGHGTGGHRSPPRLIRHAS